MLIDIERKETIVTDNALENIPSCIGIQNGFGKKDDYPWPAINFFIA